MKYQNLVAAMGVLTISLYGESQAADAVTISRISGYDSTANGLMASTPIRFYFNYEVGEKRVAAIGNAFEFYSIDGAMWQPIEGHELVPLSMWFNLISEFLEYSVDGQDADTLDFYQVDGHSPAVGLPPGYNDELFYVETRFTDEQIGKTMCVDTGGRQEFLWAASDASGIFPTWEGLQCFEIVDCCVGHRGDINGDGAGPNILDLTRLVDYIFRGAGAPICKNEADVNGDGLPHRINDLTFIVDYMHRGGPPPSNCPGQ